VATDEDQVEREAHAEGVDRAAARDQERVVGREVVEPREAEQARTEGACLEEMDAAREVSTR
jgi:hypothetical protein